MLKACPPIHGYGAELNFDFHHLLAVVKENRSFYYKMQTAVSVGLRVGDIILFFDKFYIILLQKSIRQLIYIRRIGADYTHSGNIKNVLFYTLGTHAPDDQQ